MFDPLAVLGAEGEEAVQDDFEYGTAMVDPEPVAHALLQAAVGAANQGVTLRDWTAQLWRLYDSVQQALIEHKKNTGERPRLRLVPPFDPPEAA